MSGRYGVDIREWGPAAWRLFHAAAYTYPKNPTAEDQDNLQAFVHHIQHILPCAKCKGHFGAHLRAHPLDASSPRSVSEWMNEAHNAVNRRTGAREVPYLENAARYLPPDLFHLIDPSTEEVEEMRRYQAEVKQAHNVVVAEPCASDSMQWCLIALLVIILLLVLGLVGFAIYKSTNPRRAK